MSEGQSVINVFHSLFLLVRTIVSDARILETKKLTRRGFEPLPAYADEKPDQIRQAFT